MKIANRPAFPVAVSSSLLSAWGTCEAQGYWKIFRNQVPNLENLHLHAGGAFAKGLECARKAFFIDGVSQEDAEIVGMVEGLKAYGDFEVSSEQAKSWQRTVGALVNYFKQYPFASDPMQPYVFGGKPMIEFSFALPLPILHPETSEPILYTGRFDEVGQHQESTVWAVDEKTTGQLGARWANKWELRGQFIGYTYAAQEHGLPVKGVCARGIAIRKEGYDFAEAFQLFDKAQIKNWFELMCRTVARMKASWAEGEYDQNGIFSDACERFSGCDYKRLCLTNEPEVWLSQYFKTEVYSSVRGVEVEQ